MHHGSAADPERGQQYFSARFGEHLFELRSGFEVVLEPEFMTSAQAERLQGKNDKIDASAAALILQSYLDRIKKMS